MTCRNTLGRVPAEDECPYGSAWFRLVDPRQVDTGAVSYRCGAGSEVVNACDFGEVAENANWMTCMGLEGRHMLLRFR